MRRSLLHFLLSLNVAVIAAAPVLTLCAGQPAPDFSAIAPPASAATVNVTDSRFAGGAVGDLRTCADMQMTSGSAVLYSPAQCVFTSGDVGKWVQVPLAGDSNGTGLSAQISTFTDSQHVTLSAMAGENANSGTTGTIGTGNYAALAAVATYACANPNTTVNWPAGSYYIEKYKITGGGSANGVTDITWSGCSGTINTGSASIVSNGSYRQLDDDSGSSYEQTVSPFRVANSTMIIGGLEINGSVEETTSAGGSEGQSYGVVSYGSTVTIENLNVHSWPTDGVILGFNSLDTNDVMLNVSSHNNARQGVTVANVAGLLATNFQCTQIGTGFVGQYIGHPPEDCIDVEPAIAPKASGIVFNGGSMSHAIGSLISITGTTTATVENMTLDATGTTNGPFYLGAYTVTFSGNTVLGGFSCGVNSHSDQTAIFVTNNTMTVSGNNGVTCLDLFDTLGIPAYFNGNSITVTGTTHPNGTMEFWYIKQANGNTFSVSKNAKFTGNVNIVDWKGAQSVSNNTYSTDLTNAGDPYAASYTGVNLACGEVSQEPTYFVVTAGTAPCPGTGTRSGGSTLGGGASVH